MDLSEAQIEELRRLLAMNRKIVAIKEARGWLGIGLKEAKELVEAIEAGRAPQPRGLGASPAGVLPEVVEALRAGQKILAVKLVRERFGVGLREAKTTVEAIEAELEGGGAAAPSSSPFGAAEAEIRGLVRSGRKIEAIKMVREVTGWGLREAKGAVDGLAHEEGR